MRSGRFDDPLVAGISNVPVDTCGSRNLGTESRSIVARVSRPGRQERIMSGVNGDKARFNRRRRHKISRRQSREKMLKVLAEKHLVAPAAQVNLKENVA